MKKVLIATLALALVATMVGLGVHAYFSDTESTQTSFKAGTLDLEVNGKNGEVVTFEWNNLSPGTQPHYSLKLKNIGTIDGNLDLEDISFVSNENNLTEPEIEAGDTTADEGELDDVLNLRLFLDYDRNGWVGPGDKTIFYGKVKDIAGNYDLDEPISAGGDMDFIVELYDWWNTSMDNQAQDDSLVLSMKIELNQNAD
ncbi:MAG: hypothetical protein H5T95_14075 [Firmicutes bacterium]|nr:hypothetical protein [Bacillota bacterium]